MTDWQRQNHCWKKQNYMTSGLVFYIRNVGETETKCKEVLWSNETKTHHHHYEGLWWEHWTQGTLLQAMGGLWRFRVKGSQTLKTHPGGKPDEACNRDGWEPTMLMSWCGQGGVQTCIHARIYGRIWKLLFTATWQGFHSFAKNNEEKPAVSWYAKPILTYPPRLKAVTVAWT